jgi:hypothetical protein
VGQYSQLIILKCLKPYARLEIISILLWTPSVMPLVLLNRHIAMCRVFRVHFSGFCAWLEKPLSNRAIEDQRLLRLIKQFYVASGATYGSSWIHRDIREPAETCSVHRVARLMRENKVKSQIGYQPRYIKGGKLANVAANVLDRNFNPDEPNQAWVSDISYVRSYEGFLYVATVLDLFSRRIVGWSMDKPWIGTWPFGRYSWRCGNGSRKKQR